MKNIVIIGAGMAGMGLARELAKHASFPSETHRIIVLEKRAFALWQIGALRAAVVPGFEDKVIAPLDKIFSDQKGSKHAFLAGVEVASLEDDAVVLKSPTSEFPDGRIPFERAILATGAEYPFPMRPTSNDMDETKRDFRRLQKDVEKAKSILILGGGPVGVELAGEIRAVYPDKKITMVAKSDLLVPQMQNAKLHQKLLSQMEKARVDVHLGDSVSVDGDIPLAKLIPSSATFRTKKGVMIQADIVFSAVGTRPDVALVPRVQEGASAQDKTGFVKVKADLHVQSEGGALSRYFAIGDVNDVRGGKTAMNIKGQIPVAVASILRDIVPQSKVAAKETTDPMRAICVPFGPKGGATLLPIFGTFGEWATSMMKGKSLFLGQFQQLYT